MHFGYTELTAVDSGRGAAANWGRLARMLGGNTDIPSPTRVGAVMAAFDRSVFVELTEVERVGSRSPAIIVIGRSELPATPLLTRVETTPDFSFQRLGLRKQEPCRTHLVSSRGAPSAVRLSIGNILEVTVPSDHRIPPPISQPEERWTLADALDGGTLHQRAQNLVSELAGEVTDGLDWLDRLKGEPPPAVEELTEAVASSLLESEAPAGELSPPAPVVDLLGRGPGSTPAGDDVIGGLLLSLDRMDSVWFRSRLAGLGREIATLSKDRTTTISAAHLEQAALGRAPLRLERFLDRLLGCPNGDLVREAALELVEIGHTSGADHLVGAIIGVQFVGPALHRAEATNEELPKTSPRPPEAR